MATLQTPTAAASAPASTAAASAAAPTATQAESAARTATWLPEPWCSEPVTVVVPTYNEAENLPVLVAELLGLGLPGLRVLVVDDGSPDGTGDVADRLAAADQRVTVLHRRAKDGLGRAYVAGMTRALADGAEFVMQMDADLSHPTAAVPEMIGVLMSTGADVVIGSRYVTGGQIDTEWGAHRKLLSAWANFYVRAVLRLRIKDVTAGFKIWRRSALEAVDLASLCSNGYSFQVEMHHRATRRDLVIVETPISFAERRAGTSKMSLATQWESAVMPWRLRGRR
jgi:dolichol-phosphate mannosyltransferase